jgi:hypothetical protein
MRGYARPPDVGEHRCRQHNDRSARISRRPLPPLPHKSPLSHHICSEACVGHRAAFAGQNSCKSTARVGMFCALQPLSLTVSLQDVDASSWLEIRRCVDVILLMLLKRWWIFYARSSRHIHLNETHAGAGSIFTQLKVMLTILITCQCWCKLRLSLRPLQAFDATRHSSTNHSKFTKAEALIKSRTNLLE